ncbi:MAG: DUF3999 domain-containing protein [Proteobacteria bacterium]|nr:DUF3999 domain-containing protein [Pseudomonadota bacterium]
MIKLLSAAALAVMGFGILVCLPAAQAEELDTSNYAYIQKLSIEPGHAIYETDIPDALYMSSRRSGIDSVQVLKSSGEPISFSVLKAEAEKIETTETIELPFFPLTGEKINNLDDIKLKIVRDKNSLLVNVISRDYSVRQHKTHRGYIVNLEKLEKDIDELMLEWSSAKGSFITELKIEASDDLINWRATAISSVLANMSFDGNNLSRNTIKIGQDTGKYLRIGWEKGKYLPAIDKMTAAFKTQETKRQRSWHELVPVKSKDENIYEFELPGWMPLDQIKVVLPEDNSATSVNFESRPDSKASWRSRGGKLVYRLSLEGKSIVDDTVGVSTSRDRYWRIRIPDAEIAIGGTAPKLVLGWQAERVRFLARGATDYLLALSIQTDINNGRRYDTLLAEINNGNGDDIVPVKAEPTETIKQLSAADEVETMDRGDIKNWILWAVLLFGVAVLGFMAMRLSRQIKDTE